MMSKELRELQERFDLYKKAKEKDIEWLESKLKEADETIQAVNDSLYTDEELELRYPDEMGKIGVMNQGKKDSVKIQIERTLKALNQQSSCSCSQAKGLDNDEKGNLYCIECEKNLNQQDNDKG